MCRIAIVAVAVTLVAGAVCPQTAPVPPGWFKAGSKPADYDVGVDSTIRHKGNASAFLKSRTPDAAGFVTLMQTIDAERWHGKRVRLDGWLRTSSVERTAVLWMRIDGRVREQMLGFDNMHDRELRGTVDWTRVQIVLDVAPEAVSISFGIILAGAGEVWADDLRFEVVTNRVPTTARRSRLPSDPVNLDFERRPGA